MVVMTVDPVTVYDPEHETTMDVHPDDLLEHFKVGLLTQFVKGGVATDCTEYQLSPLPTAPSAACG